MLPKHSIFRNALLLTAIDLLLRGISMSFQIYLSGVIGAAGLGLLQLVAAVGTLGMTLGLSGVRTTAMYLCAEEYGKRRPGGMRHVMRLCILWSSVFSILTAAALWGFSDQLAAVWLKDLRAASGLRILALSLPVECLVCVLCGYFTACGKLRRLACVEVAERLVSLALTFLLLRLWAHSELERACCSLLLGGGGAAVFSAVWLGLLMRKDLRQYPPVPQPPQLQRQPASSSLYSLLHLLQTNLIYFSFFRYPGLFSSHQTALFIFSKAARPKYLNFSYLPSACYIPS